jgi:cell division protein FtsB
MAEPTDMTAEPTPLSAEELAFLATANHPGWIAPWSGVRLLATIDALTDQVAALKAENIALLNRDDAVCAALGIQDDFTTPVEAVAALNEEVAHSEADKLLTRKMLAAAEAERDALKVERDRIAEQRNNLRRELRAMGRLAHDYVRAGRDPGPDSVSTRWDAVILRDAELGWLKAFPPEPGWVPGQPLPDWIMEGGDAEGE